MKRDGLAGVKSAFFDRNKVAAFMDGKTREALTRVGRMIRKTAQYSMRSKKGSAPPGSPPHAHKSKLLKRMLFFSYDANKKSVVIGPEYLPRKNPTYKVPGTLEHGGIVTRTRKTGSVWVAKYPSHPFMVPAMAANQGKIAQQFAAASVV